MTPDEFRKQLNDWTSKERIFLPEFVLDYINKLEKKAGEKKTVFTVRAIYQHDMDVEHRIVYQGTNAKTALKNCYDEVREYIEDYRDNYRYPLPDVDEKFKTHDDYYKTTYTGLQIKQFFLDWINEAIKNKKNISFNWGYDGDFDPECDGEEGGFELDVTEV